jgi:transcriptional regulator GlxA family with amidase domain
VIRYVRAQLLVRFVFDLRKKENVKKVVKFATQTNKTKEKILSMVNVKGAFLKTQLTVNDICISIFWVKRGLKRKFSGEFKDSSADEILNKL